MRYIGGKSLILHHINQIILSYTNKVQTVLDIFAGSGATATNFKNQQFSVIANDFLYFSYILNKANLCLNAEPTFDKLKECIKMDDPLIYLNNLTIEKTDFYIEDCFIYKNYSPNPEYNCERMYFKCENALKIDIIRLTIEKWKSENIINEDEYFYLLASLINAVPYIANIAGVYSAYLKYWDKRTLNSLELKRIDIIKNDTNNDVYNKDAFEISKQVKADLVYIDPPYNSRQYLPNYHILETIAKYDYPKLHGISGMRNYDDQKSIFCQKNKVKKAFSDLLNNLNAKYIIISYNNEGLLATEDLSNIICNTCKSSTFKLFEYEYRRYRNKIPNNKIGLKEQLYFCEKQVN